ncbi:MAG: hypothetical protein OEV59_08685 [Deltaproteobacteria bacterium]|nr:hypothetical protein [Deltaproteobacteria bacterium]
MKYLLITARFLLPAVAAGKGAELEERLKGLLRGIAIIYIITP